MNSIENNKASKPLTKIFNKVKNKKGIIIGIVSLLGILLLANLAIFIQRDSFIFQNEISKSVAFPDPSYVPTFRRLEKANTTYSLWELSKKSESGLEEEKAIIYLHGNSGRVLNIIAGLNTSNYSVYSPAYPGFNESQGSPSMDNVYETALNTYDYLVNDKKIKESNIIIFGHGLGGSVATHLASLKPKASKLVIINTFSSMQSLCYNQYKILCGLEYFYFNTAVDAQKIEIPVRQFALKDDEVIPYSEGQKLFTYFNKSNDKTFTDLNKYNHNFLDFSIIKLSL
jgi:acetyl esterase/lipase